MTISEAHRVAEPVRPPAPRARDARGPWVLGLGAWVLVALLALLLRLPYLNVAPGIDEGGVAWIARQWGSGHGWLYGGAWLDRPPLLVAAYRVAVLAGPIGIRIMGAVAAVGLVASCSLVAHLVAGERGGRVAALLAALLSGSAAISAVYSPAELLAAVPATLSVAALVAGHQSGRARAFLAAGALAVVALLVKQSFLDAGLAGLAYLATGVVRSRAQTRRAAAAYALGALVPLAGVGAWLLAAHLRAADLLDALFGFRLQALHTLEGSNIPLLTRLTDLAGPALRSGLVLAVPVAAWGLWRRPSDRRIAVVLVAWLAGGLAGVLAGGSYWPHYLIQIVPASAVGVAAVLASLPRRLMRVALLGVVIAAAVTAVAAGVAVTATPPRRTEAAVARYVRAHARPGDTSYVLYARANLNLAIGLRTPFPYSWSLMMRARPDARGRLLDLLRSSGRPTWIVRWQPPGRWHLDPTGAVARLLATDYTSVASFDGRRVLLRADRLRPDPGLTGGVRTSVRSTSSRLRGGTPTTVSAPDAPRGRLPSRRPRRP